MGEFPTFHGIAQSNRPANELWGRDLFQKALGIALVNRMGDAGTPLNYVVTDRGSTCHVEHMPVPRLYGGHRPPFDDIRFDFTVPYGPFESMAAGVPDSDLVAFGPDGEDLCRLDIMASVMPDAATKDLPVRRWGPEITVRTPIFENLALSIAQSVSHHRDEALRILDKASPEIVDWTDWDAVSDHVEDMTGALDTLESSFSDCQTPFLLQYLWMTEDDGPLLADDAMDAFVWSDFALSRLFLDSDRGTSDGSATRPRRCAVRLFRIVHEALQGMNPDLDSTIAETGYGISAGKEFMVNGKVSSRVMSCDRLLRPAMSAGEVKNLASRGFERMIAPERKLEVSIYYAARDIRG